MTSPPAFFGRYELWSTRIRASRSSRRILIVDDYIDIAGSLALVFQDESFSTKTAYSGEDAIEVARRWRPDVALIDISLPDFTGIEVGHRLRTVLLLTETVLIAHTALDAASIREGAKQAGFDAFLGKPMNPNHTITLANYLCPE